MASDQENGSAAGSILSFKSNEDDGEKTSRLHSSLVGSEHSCYSLCGRLPELTDVEDSSPVRGRLTSGSTGADGATEAVGRKSEASNALSPAALNGAVLSPIPASHSPGSTENRSGVERDQYLGHLAPDKSSTLASPEFLTSGMVLPLVTGDPLVKARSWKRPEVRGPIWAAARRSVGRSHNATEGTADKGEAPRPGMAPGRWHSSGCRDCGAQLPAPAPALMKGTGAYCWLCGARVVCSRQTLRCRSAARACISAGNFSSVRLVNGCSSSGVVVSSPRKIPQNIQGEWKALEEQCSKLVRSRRRSHLAELSSLLGIYFLAESSQSSAYWDNAKEKGNPEGRTYIALKEWSGVSSTEEFLVKNAVSTFLETPLYSPRDVRAAELVAAAWGYDRVVKARHFELIGMSADLVSSAIIKGRGSRASTPCLMALTNLSRLLHTGSVALVSRSNGDWGDLTAHGGGPKTHELLLALSFGVSRELIGSAMVIMVTKRKHNERARLTTGVFDKRSVTAGDVPPVLKNLEAVEHWGPVVEGSPSLATVANLARGADSKWRPAGPGYHEAVARWVVGASLWRMLLAFFCLSCTALYAYWYDKGTSHTLAALLLLDMLKEDLGVPLWLYQTGDDVRLSGALAASPSCHWLLVVSVGSVDVVYSTDFARAWLFGVAVSLFWCSLLLLNLVKVIALDRACSRSSVSRRRIRQKDHKVWKAIFGKGVYTAKSLFMDACCGDGRLLSVSWLKIAEGDRWLTRKTVIGHTVRWPPPAAVRKAQVVGKKI